jgi:hypothetical protein
MEEEEMKKKKKKICRIELMIIEETRIRSQ